MDLKVEEISEEGKILLVYKRLYPQVSLLKKRLEEYGFQVFTTTEIPDSLSHFSHIFTIDMLVSKNQLKRIAVGPKILHIIFGRKSQMASFDSLLQKDKSLASQKIVNVNAHKWNADSLEKILWFALSTSKEAILDLQKEIETMPDIQANRSPFQSRHPTFYINRNKLFMVAFVLILIMETFFIFPFCMTSFFVARSYYKLSKSDLLGARAELEYAAPLLKLSKASYELARPLLSVFFMALATDNLVSIPTTAYNLADAAFQSQDNAEKAFGLIMKKDKTATETTQVRRHLENLKDQLSLMQEFTTVLVAKLNFPVAGARRARQKLLALKETLKEAERIIEQSESLFGAHEPKNYLILFQNNMEIRPGGGFIGSFAVATVDNYTLADLYVEDVYEADGQLRGHVEPPQAIRTYLKQPHWFLRDSNFSPDFKTNLAQAEFFLDKELQLHNFHGGVAITTTAISYLLEAVGDIYLPDYNESINSDNFYIKAQTYSERGFFPGSKQKKNFLESLTHALLLKFSDRLPLNLFQAIRQGLQEKHITTYFKDEEIQSEIDSLGWSGSIIIPRCTNREENCVVDGIFPIDANLGVNKANFFVRRLMDLNVTVDRDGSLNNTFTIAFSNDSQSEVFPGGTYQNFFQLYVPKSSLIEQVVYNGKIINHFEVREEGLFTVVSHFIKVPPQGTATLRVRYHPRDKLSLNENTYQLIVQKQIGSSNNDFTLQIHLPDNISATGNNFPALAKDNSLLYNTTLSTDRIFLIDLIRRP